MKTIEDLSKEVQAEKKKIAVLEAEIKLLAKQSKYPKSKWLELWKYDGEVLLINGVFFNKKYLIFAALVETCKEWNRIDKFEPDWNEFTSPKFCIVKSENKICVDRSYVISRSFSFKTQETAKLFFETYKTELEQVKDLL